MLRVTSFRAALILFCVATSFHTAQAEEYNAGLAIRAAAGLIEKEHLRQWPLDDKLSRRWLASLIERLDPDKLLFLQSDRDEFEKYADRLDDFAKEENLEFSYLLRKRYQQRWTEAAKLAEQQLATEHDFTLDEEVPRRYEKAPADEKELAERWRKRIKLELLIEKIHGRKLAEVKTQLASRYERLRRQAAELDDEQWSAQYIRALVLAHEPHGWYFSETDTTRYNDPYRLRRFYLDVKFTEQRGKILISTIPGLSRQRTQKLLGQELLAIRRINGQIIDVVGMPSQEFYFDLVHKFQGPLEQDTTVILELLDPLTLERMSLKCSRYEIRRS